MRHLLVRIALRFIPSTLMNMLPMIWEWQADQTLRLQVYVALIAFFNYYYTFLQLEPKDLADSLKRQVRLQQRSQWQAHH